MKKVVPFIFPAIALVVVLLLAYRWFRLNQAPQGDITANGQDVVIEDLDQTAANRILRGTGDYKTAPLSGDQATNGAIRYEIKDGKVNFSVSAELAKPATGFYQAWIKTSTGTTKAFRLEEGKAGYIGTAAVSSDEVPFEVIISLEQVDDATLEKVILSGSVKE